jgi:AraC-like DNA-binding protein
MGNENRWAWFLQGGRRDGNASKLAGPFHRADRVVPRWHAVAVYRERASRRVAGATAWTRTVGGAGAEHRIVPDGCMDLIWLSGELMVAGPDTRAQLAVSPPHAAYAALRFPPGLAPSVLGLPADDLRDQRVDLTRIWPAADTRRLADACWSSFGSRGLDAVVAELESLAAERLSAGGGADPWVARLVGWLRAGSTVRAAAGRAGLSERQLHRRCLPLFGYGPKTLGRVLRFDRALALARAGKSFAEVAVDAGYADQAHLSREVRGMAGVPLRALV